ncbi:sigma-70 family RNA polymerase sigma factor [Paludisphaera borealis]|uniref:ECF RNA polymerase sigma factor SigW n=1 Tax=Paludisphaera borealis TaxID=1387353 RepID=A0A1U7CMX8_9BACT|nr:sigma-70 family RNA polymerase sigma factor [Paludisphaera borealis]APW60295.1 ECF RNA polymerase sigma factor SigW [Paludisphaera borealis]
MNTVATDRIIDEKLWRSVREGDAEAFEQVVLRHQALVSGVAYNACGNLALSEDVAQETFWAAWRQRDSLIDPGRLKSWLCGIARNLGANALRRSSAGKPAGSVERVNDLADDDPGPDDVAMSREEEARLWLLLEQIPPTYREPLILFYRQDQSVAEVASCLDLTEDAVKQRLARGRSMLRDRIADQVEAGLRRSRPGRSFTAGVMAGLSLGAAGAKSAVAAGTSVTAGTVAKGALASGLSGGLLGSLIGIAGGWLGVWLPAQMAPTVRERELYLRAGRRMVLASLIFTGAILVMAKTLAGTPRYMIGLGLAIVLFQVYIFAEAIRLSRIIKAIRKTVPAATDLNQTAMRRGAASLAGKIRGRVYQSPIRLLGLPLLDIQVADPVFVTGHESSPLPRVARGWVAIGDDARGILLGVGSKGYGLVAIGGRAVGGLSMGGVAVGVVAIGGLGLGLVGLGGLAVGVLAFGGGAVGWQACGGLAVAWDLAIGGGAIAWNTAAGGAAVAHGVAGGDPAGFDQPAGRLMRWTLNHRDQVRLGFIALAVVVGALPSLLMYRRNRGSGLKASAVLVPVFLLFYFAYTKAESPDRVVRFGLDNGLTVLARPIAGAKQTALVVLYNVGGDHDPEGRSGLAHIVEHIYVTAKAGETPARSAVDFFRSYQAGCNAQTGDRYTAVATVFPSEQLDDELRQAAARMSELTITASDLDRERPRLLDEVANMFERVPSLAAQNNARELVRPTPRGGRRGGLPAQVQALPLDDVRAHWKRYYKPRNAVLAAAGAIDPATFRAAVTKHFGTIPGGDPAPSPGEPGAAVLGEERKLAAAGSPATACLAMAPPQPGSDLYAPYLVLGTRLMKAGAGLGGGPGMAPVYMPLLDDPSLVAVSSPARPGETPEQIAGRLSALLEEAVKPDLGPGEVTEVEQMFGLFLGTVEPPDQALALNPYAVAFTLGRREQLGLDPVKLRAAFQAMKPEAVRRAATEVFGPSRRARVFLAPQ